MTRRQLSIALLVGLVGASVFSASAALATTLPESCDKTVYKYDWGGYTKYFRASDGKCSVVTQFVDYPAPGPGYSAKVLRQLDGTGWKLTVKIPNRSNRAPGGQVSVKRDGKVVESYIVNGAQNRKNKATFALPNLSKYRSHTLKVYFRGKGTIKKTLIGTATVKRQATPTPATPADTSSVPA